MSTGYIKLYRKVCDNKLWLSEPFTRAQAWVDLLLLANHKESIIFIRGNQIDLDTGQLAWSMKALAKRWRWSEGKVSRFFDMLETERQIERRNEAATSITTILRYKEYQVNGAENSLQTARRRRTDSVQTATDNNDKNDNNVKNGDIPVAGATDTQRQAFQKFREWIVEHAPNVARMKEPFTLQQYLRISGQARDAKGSSEKTYSPDAVREMLRRMHNYAGLHKNNVSAYYTMVKWFGEDERRG